jgi:hypothetical protein
LKGFSVDSEKYRSEECFGMIDVHKLEGPITDIIETLHDIIRTKALLAAAEGYTDLSLVVSHDHSDRGHITDTYYEIVGYRDETPEEEEFRLRNDKARAMETIRILRKRYDL